VLFYGKLVGANFFRGKMLDARIAAYLAFACLVSASLAVEPLNPMKKQRADFNPKPYFFRVREWIQGKLNTDPSA
jgi:hypothetical protein